MLIKRIINKLLRKFGYRISEIIQEDSFSKPSYSQCGEDILIEYVFNLRGVKNPTYIDIGANDPVFLNNTYRLYKQGARGINIEPNTLLAKKFKIIRPEDTTLSIGISQVEGEFSFYVFKDDTLSTFDKDEVKNYLALGYEMLREEKIRTCTLESVIKQYNNNVFPDLLSIDVEGLDFEIIKTIDFSRFKPKVICVETANYSPIGAGDKRTDLMKYIEDQGYTLYADTNLNSIYVQNDFWFIEK